MYFTCILYVIFPQAQRTDAKPNWADENPEEKEQHRETACRKTKTQTWTRLSMGVKRKKMKNDDGDRQTPNSSTTPTTQK